MELTQDIFAGASAIIFDCDGTLIDSAPVYVKAWAAAFAAVGGQMDEGWYRERNGLSEGVLIEAFERETGLKLDHSKVVRLMRDAYLKSIEGLAEISLIANIARRQKGRIPLAVASGGPAGIVRPSLEHLQLDHLFDKIVTLDDVGVPKPEPDLFLYAAELVGVPPQLCVVFEDSEPGLLAAQRAGMRSIDVRVHVSIDS